MKHLFFFLSFLLTLCSHAETIIVNNQQEFDALSTTLSTALRKGVKDITVEIIARQLTFADDQIKLSNLQATDASISIHGNGVLLTGQGRIVKAVSHPDFMYLRNGAYYNPWTDFVQLSDTIVIQDKTQHLCNITTPSKNKKDRAPKNKFIQYTCWYTSNISPITAITKRQISFDAGDWAAYRGERTYHVNMEYDYAKQGPRYRLFGTKKVSGKLYESTAATLLHLAGCKLRTFSIDGIHVVGSSATGPLLFLNHCTADRYAVTGSTFSCIGGTVLLDRCSQNVEFSHNTVDTFHGEGFVSESGATGAKVIGNQFSDCCLGMKQQFAIVIHSKGFTVADNTISDFCYGAIGVGIWGGSSSKDTCSGTVTDNHIFMSDAFRYTKDQHSLMDSGAIYTWTRCDDITIARNNIHDITGMKDNRGIFCDDGTRGVTLDGNRVENIVNSYDIDLRWTDFYKKQVPDHNTGNAMLNNITTGKVRFETQRR